MDRNRKGKENGVIVVTRVIELNEKSRSGDAMTRVTTFFLPNLFFQPGRLAKKMPGASRQGVHMKNETVGILNQLSSDPKARARRLDVLKKLTVLFPGGVKNGWAD